MGGVTHPSSNNFPACIALAPPSHEKQGVMVPTIISRSSFPKTQKPLLGTLIRDAQLFPGRVFPGKQKPLLGTLIRDGQLFSRSCFSQKTRAPARNADPRRTTVFRMCFSQETRAPARNADPRRTTFSGCVFPRKQTPLLGTLIRDEELSFMCTSEIIHNASMLISDHQ